MTGLPLLGLNGLNDQPTTWQPLIDAGLPIHGADLPWGGADPVAGPAEAMVDAVVDCFRAAAAADGPYAVVAHSLATAPTLMALTLSQPACLPAAAVLVSPVYATAAAIASPAGRRLHRAQFDAVFKQRLTVASTAEPEITRQMANLVLRGVRPALREEVLRLICRLDSCPLQSIRVPLLVLRGSHDVGCAKAQSALLAARLPQATWVTRPTWNHFCHIHDPAGVAAVIKSWFATLAQPGSPLDSSQPKGPPP